MTNNAEKKLFVFYKITCFDESVTDCYVGSTTNLARRRYLHKFMCDHHHEKKYNHVMTNLYKTINEHGGWQNWKLSPIDKKECCKLDARIYETKLMEDHKSSLNKNRAYSTKEQQAEIQKKWQEAHKAELKETYKKWREEHVEEKKQLQKNWCEKNPEYFKKWRENNKEKIVQYYQIRKAKKIAEAENAKAEETTAPDETEKIENTLLNGLKDTDTI